MNTRKTAVECKSLLHTSMQLSLRKLRKASTWKESSLWSSLLSTSNVFWLSSNVFLVLLMMISILNSSCFLACLTRICQSPLACRSLSSSISLWGYHVTRRGASSFKREEIPWLKLVRRKFRTLGTYTGNKKTWDCETHLEEKERKGVKLTVILTFYSSKPLLCLLHERTFCDKDVVGRKPETSNFNSSISFLRVCILRDDGSFRQELHKQRWKRTPVQCSMRGSNVRRDICSSSLETWAHPKTNIFSQDFPSEAGNTFCTKICHLCCCFFFNRWSGESFVLVFSLQVYMDIFSPFLLHFNWMQLLLSNSWTKHEQGSLFVFSFNYLNIPLTNHHRTRKYNWNEERRKMWQNQREEGNEHQKECSGKTIWVFSSLFPGNSVGKQDDK